MAESQEKPIYGLVGEFATPEDAVALARQLRSEGFSRFDVYSPLPIEEMNDVLPGRPIVFLAMVLFLAAIAGGVLGYLMQYWIAVVFYPINVGGRPLHSWPAFLPTAWEIGALFVVYVGFAALLIACRLPKLYHPIFDAPRFDRATQDRIFLCIDAADRHFDRAKLGESFARHRAVSVAEVAQ